MSIVKAEIEKRLKRKKTELATFESERATHQAAINELDLKIEAANSSIQEYQSLLNLFDKTEDSGEASTQPEIALRRNSDVWNAREALRRLGQPTYIDRLLEEMGKPLDSTTRSSLSGQIGWYVRKNQIFTRPEPNTFGLREWGEGAKGSQGQADSEDKSELQPSPLPALESEEAH